MDTEVKNTIVSPTSAITIPRVVRTESSAQRNSATLIATSP